MNYQKKAQTFVVCMTMMVFGLFTVVAMQLG